MVASGMNDDDSPGEEIQNPFYPNDGFWTQVCVRNLRFSFSRHLVRAAQSVDARTDCDKPAATGGVDDEQNAKQQIKK